MQDFGKYIERFISLGDVESLYIAYDCLVASEDKSYAEVLIDISKHFEEGCKKYGENNWRKGIPVKSFLNSALRHLVQHLAGATDEPHMRAACWNLLCLIWTWEHHPECRGEFDKLNSANKTKADENL
jgi:hypothetical protein